MKKNIWIFFGLIALFGCKKNEDNTYVAGKIITKVNYERETDQVKKKNGDLKEIMPDSLYANFGNYITSITPRVFKAKFHTIRFVDELKGFSQIELLNNNLPDKDPLRYADFTSNSSVTLVPSLNGNLTNEESSFADTVLFKYFYFRIQFFYQEFELPSGYDDVNALDQFYFANVYEDDENRQMWCTRVNNILSARYRLFMIPLYEAAQRAPDAFVFGGTDSTYLLNLFIHPHDYPDNLPYDGDYIVRSNNYTPITFKPNFNSNKTTTILTTLTFNYDNLIQIYAGKDNIPYTKDDIFVYEPNFFDRLKVNVIIE